jgi:hypothetical protein
MIDGQSAPTPRARGTMLHPWVLELGVRVVILAGLWGILAIVALVVGRAGT